MPQSLVSASLTAPESARLAPQALVSLVPAPVSLHASSLARALQPLPAPAPSVPSSSGHRSNADPEGAKDQGLIDRVLKASIALERAETDGIASEEELKVTADQVWGELAPSHTRAEEAEAARGGATPPLSKRGGKPLEAKSVPPSAGAPSPGRSRASVFRSYAVATVHGAGRLLDRALSPFLRALAPLARRIPGPLVMASAAGATVVVDYAARALLPALFGFAPVAGLWVAAGLGGVMIPALIAVRLSLARKDDPVLAPLVRYADGLLGVLIGAAIVTAVGVLGSDLTAAFTGPMAKGAGLFSLAPFLGVFAYMAAMPVIYGAGHAAWGLRRGAAVSLRFPIQIPFSLSLFPMLVSPLISFLAFTGGVPLFLGIPLLAAAVAVYFRSRGHLEIMTATKASGGTARAELSPDPQWRLDRIPGERTTPDGEIHRARLQAVWWGAALVLFSLGLVVLHHLSLAAVLSSIGGSILVSLKYMLPMFLLGGLAAIFFKGAKPVTQGLYPETVRELSARAGLPAPKVYAGKAEGPPNAFAAGMFQRLSVVALEGSITRLMTVRELRGVLAHELSHVKYRHMLALFGALALFPIFGATVSLLQMTVAYWATLVWVIGVMGVLRANERMADAGAAKLLGDSRGLATGLRKFALMGMAAGKVPDREGSLLYRLLLSHPDPLERVQALGRMAKTDRLKP